MRVSREEVIKMARIANLSMSEEDIKRYQEKLEDLLEFIDTLRASDTDFTDGISNTMKYDDWLKEGTFAKGEDGRRIEPLS